MSSLCAGTDKTAPPSRRPAGRAGRLADRDRRADGDRESPDVLRSAARADSLSGYRRRCDPQVSTLDLLCTGSLAVVFDGPTSRPIDPAAPAVAVDLSRIGAAGAAC